MGRRSWSARVAGPAVLVVALLAGAAPPVSGSATSGVDGNPPSSAPQVVPSAPGTAPRGTWSWPLHPDPAVARQFVAPPSPWAAGHRGVDLLAEPGAEVLAPAEGVVVHAGVVVGRGVVVVAHAGGLRTSFEPVDDPLPRGTPVAARQRVATLSAVPGHCAPRACLHWGLRHGDAYLDPLRTLRPARPPVLLPLHPPERTPAHMRQACWEPSCAW